MTGPVNHPYVRRSMATAHQRTNRTGRAWSRNRPSQRRTGWKEPADPTSREIPQLVGPEGIGQHGVVGGRHPSLVRASYRL